ncbi:Maf family protein [Marinobacter persicus]|uniref:dTTP/UTP pyrophosphatase n=1 Tax=Marinobacter persicus TaxID=930118 RepID=A0A2S6G990_9GAMM|nr:nucleoside triphosphate pyrophosphatase [Marinobacter persicus]PPK52977.1 septum formation protein [Marinobacter persicus]PPK55854.1 septum formation protein [Marinobacter persicus]PPK59449.1 septum formation protein [Marinobacter persicus]
MEQLILASASPRRTELLTSIGVSFDVQPADIDETPGPDETAYDYVERLAREKAEAVALSNPHQLVMGSDTSVVLEGEILGKPATQAEARSMLTRLSGNTHQVMTAVALVGKGQCQSVVSVTNVTFRQLEAGEIDAYIATGEPMDKAGGYGIQGLGGIFVTDLQGSYSAVVGLPLQETAALLAQAGHPVWRNWSRR